MRSSWQAAKMLWTLHFENTSDNKSANTVELDVEGAPCEVDVYEPHVTYRGTIAVIHGMSPQGKDDSRIVALCQAMCQQGFRIVAPDILSIKALKIESLQVDVIARTVEALATHKMMTPSGQLALLAPSFSGAMSLAAAAMPSVRDKITSVCAIGAFTDVDSVMDYLLTDDSADLYGRYIVLKNLLPRVVKDDVAIQRALDAAIQDNLNESTDVELHGCLSQQTPEEQALAGKVFNDVAYRMHVFESLRPVLREELEAMNIISRLDGLSAKVFLVHGQHDRVIPSEQSKKLYASLKQCQKDVDLVLTPFISHGDTRFSPKRVFDLARVINGFALFFDELKPIH